MLQIDLKFILTVALFIIEMINTYFYNLTLSHHLYWT